MSVSDHIYFCLSNIPKEHGFVNKLPTSWSCTRSRPPLPIYVQLDSKTPTVVEALKSLRDKLKHISNKSPDEILQIMSEDLSWIGVVPVGGPWYAVARGRMYGVFQSYAIMSKQVDAWRLETSKGHTITACFKRFTHFAPALGFVATVGANREKWAALDNPQTTARQPDVFDAVVVAEAHGMDPFSFMGTPSQAFRPPMPNTESRHAAPLAASEASTSSSGGPSLAVRFPEGNSSSAFTGLQDLPSASRSPHASPSRATPSRATPRYAAAPPPFAMHSPSSSSIRSSVSSISSVTESQLSAQLQDGLSFRAPELEYTEVTSVVYSMIRDSTGIAGQLIGSQRPPSLGAQLPSLGREADFYLQCHGYTVEMVRAISEAFHRSRNQNEFLAALVELNIPQTEALYICRIVGIEVGNHSQVYVRRDITL
ncbi:hypothetical protein EIP91_009021 [Steccherinum ochraceum]|uniref:Uncharacterized protein n=1 Tax=Steccherinum ochraceum TaxID=92696 RepID=A0A4R0RFC8_9APHY|nr:hypothetical protein EIP91_009021 [Steccherinum ochraceum]